MKKLNKIVTQVKQDILTISYRGHAGHIGSALSIADILTVLYFRILKVDPKNPQMKKRDRFILSKGHACAALYAVLGQKGFFSRKTLLSYHSNGGLSGRPPASSWNLLGLASGMARR